MSEATVPSGCSVEGCEHGEHAKSGHCHAHYVRARVTSEDAALNRDLRPSGLYIFDLPLGKWAEHGACVNAPSTLFDDRLPGESPDKMLIRQRTALAHCVICPVREKCKGEADLLHSRGLQPTGIWGGWRYFEDNSRARRKPPVNLLAVLNDPAALLDANSNENQRRAQRAAARRAQRIREKERGTRQRPSTYYAPSTVEGRQVLTITGVQMRLGIGRATVYELLSGRQIEGTKVDGRRLVFADSVDHYIAREQVSA